jgi:hypothetical protein
MSSQPPPYAATNQPAQNSEPPKLGFGARFSNMFFAPSETFADVNRASKPLLPLIALMVVVLLQIFVVNMRVKPDYHAIVVEQTEKRAGKSISDMEGQERQQAEVGVKIGETIYKYLPFVVAVFFPLGLAFFSLLYWLGTLLIQGKTTYPKVFSVVTWTFLTTSVVRGLLSILGTFIRTVDPTDPEQIQQGGISANLGPLVTEKANPVLHSILLQLDVFAIWGIVLISIGLAAICYKKKTSQTAVIPVGLAVLIFLIRVGFAAISHH